MVKTASVLKFDKWIRQFHDRRRKIAYSGIEVDGAVAVAHDAAAEYDINEVRTLGVTRREKAALRDDSNRRPFACLRIYGE